PKGWIIEEITLKKNMAPISLEKMNYTQAYLMLDAIHSGSMPKNDSLDKEEIELITVYLQKKMLEMDEPNGSDPVVRMYREEYLEIERQKALSSLTDPSPLQKEIAIVTVDCLYGRKNCE